jgi:group I intron endonuclease
VFAALDATPCSVTNRTTGNCKSRDQHPAPLQGRELGNRLSVNQKHSIWRKPSLAGETVTMEEAMHGLIYMITSPTGRVYVGKSLNFKRRIRRYKCLECKKQTLLYNSLKKHGFKSHEISVLEDGLTEDVINERECYWIFKKKSFCKDNDKGMNVTRGGEGTVGHTHTDESKRKMSIAKKGKKSKNLRPVYQFSLDGKFISQHRCEGDARREVDGSDSSICRVLSGKRLSAFGFRWSHSMELNTRENESGNNRKAVVMIDSSGRIVNTFKSTLSAGKKMSIEPKNIQAVCKNKRAKAGGYKWQYLETA